MQLRRTGSGSHLIDPSAFSDLQPLANVIADEWSCTPPHGICHASQNSRWSQPAGFDTEMAARILGRPKVGLAALAETELGVSLAKGTFSGGLVDSRPLPEAWLPLRGTTLSCSSNFAPYSPPTLSRQGGCHDSREFNIFGQHLLEHPGPIPGDALLEYTKVRTGRGHGDRPPAVAGPRRHGRTTGYRSGRVLPDAAISAAAIARPTAKEQLALPAFSGAARSGESVLVAGRRPSKQDPERELPQAAAATTGPTPLDRGRTEPRGRSASSRSSHILDRNCRITRDADRKPVDPDVARRLCWAPPGSQSVGQCPRSCLTMALVSGKIDLTCHGLSRHSHLRSHREPLAEWDCDERGKRRRSYCADRMRLAGSG